MPTNKVPGLSGTTKIIIKLLNTSGNLFHKHSIGIEFLVVVIAVLKCLLSLYQIMSSFQHFRPNEAIAYILKQCAFLNWICEKFDRK